MNARLLGLVLTAACSNAAAPTPMTRDALLVFRVHVCTVYTGASDSCIVTVGAKVVRDPQYRVVPPYGDSIGVFTSVYYAWSNATGQGSRLVAIPFDSTRLSWAAGSGLADTFTVERRLASVAHHQDTTGVSVDTVLGVSYPGAVSLYWFETFAGDSGSTGGLNPGLSCGSDFFKADTIAEQVPAT